MVSHKMSNSTRTTDEHLQDVPDGAGCTEIWEHLSNNRDSDDDGEAE